MYTIDELKSWGTVPRVHPNGFIQIDKPASRKERVHIWPDAELPKQGSHHSVHDHIFDMASLVLRGAMTNRLFDFPKDGEATHELHRARYKTAHDSTLLPTGQKGRLECSSQITVLRPPEAGRPTNLHGNRLSAPYRRKPAVEPRRAA